MRVISVQIQFEINWTKYPINRSSKILRNKRSKKLSGKTHAPTFDTERILSGLEKSNEQCSMYHDVHVEFKWHGENTKNVEIWRKTTERKSQKSTNFQVYLLISHTHSSTLVCSGSHMYILHMDIEYPVFCVVFFF